MVGRKFLITTLRLSSELGDRQRAGLLQNLEQIVIPVGPERDVPLLAKGQRHINQFRLIGVQKLFIVRN